MAISTPDDGSPAALLQLKDQILHTRRHPAGGSAESTLSALTQQCARGKTSAYTWMLLAQSHLETGDTIAALQCWHQASQAPPAEWDLEKLRVLGIDAPEAWQALTARISGLRAELLQDAYSEIRSSTDARALFRIDRALAGYLGKASVFSSHPSQRPKVLYVPGLPATGFLDPSRHPLVAPLLSGFKQMQDEFDAVLAADAGVEPFLGELPGTDLPEYVSGGAQASWDALFFFRHGQRYDVNHGRCPHTSGLLEGLDLCRIDHQAPEVCFSIMRPGTRIEPHHGVTNARVVIHMPLRVPPGCYLELTGVGRHYWREGEAMVFDDTFEHLAHNPTTSTRGILLMDAWHPDLNTAERHAFRAVVEAITRIESLA